MFTNAILNYPSCDRPYIRYICHKKCKHIGSSSETILVHIFFGFSCDYFVELPALLLQLVIEMIFSLSISLEFHAISRTTIIIVFHTILFVDCIQYFQKAITQLTLIDRRRLKNKNIALLLRLLLLQLRILFDMNSIKYFQGKFVIWRRKLYRMKK